MQIKICVRLLKFIDKKITAVNWPLPNAIESMDEKTRKTDIKETLWFFKKKTSFNVRKEKLWTQIECAHKHM